MDINEKLITTAIPLAVAAVLKIITHFFNLTGEKDKITKENIDLLKSTLAIENSLHISEYKILYEEVFSTIFKKNLYFYEIKNLICLKSPKKAIKLYLNARPYVQPSNKNNGFEYRVWNSIRFKNITFPFPLYRLSLSILYFACEFIGLTLLGRQFLILDELIKTDGKINILTYIDNVGLFIISIITIALGIKALIKLFLTPSKSELAEALGKIKDREIVFMKPPIS